MSYTPTAWQTGDTITAEKLNNMESGIEAADNVAVVTVTGTSNNFTVSHKPAQVDAAIQAGKSVQAIVNGSTASVYAYPGQLQIVKTAIGNEAVTRSFSLTSNYADGSWTSWIPNATVEFPNADLVMSISAGDGLKVLTVSTDDLPEWNTSELVIGLDGNLASLINGAYQAAYLNGEAHLATQLPSEYFDTIGAVLITALGYYNKGRGVIFAGLKNATNSDKWELSSFVIDEPNGDEYPQYTLTFCGGLMPQTERTDGVVSGFYTYNTTITIYAEFENNDCTLAAVSAHVKKETATVV